MGGARPAPGCGRASPGVEAGGPPSQLFSWPPQHPGPKIARSPGVSPVRADHALHPSKASAGRRLFENRSQAWGLGLWVARFIPEQPGTGVCGRAEVA